MDIAGLITKELGIPKQYIKNYELRKDRILILVHRGWIASLLGNNEIPDFTPYDTLVGNEIQNLFYEKEEQLFWHKLLVHVLNKPNENETLIPLPKSRVIHSCDDLGLSYAQILHYISETNFKNAWKHFYKKYIGDKVQNRDKDFLKGNSVTKNDILIDIIKRFYGCKIILGENYTPEFFSASSKQNDFEPHPNVLPALCAVETNNCFLILHHMNQIATLKDCLTFSPTLINSNYTKPLFVIYQLLQVMKNSHDRGLILGNLQLDDIFINDSLFIQVIPNLRENIYKLTIIESESLENTFNKPTEEIEFFHNYSLLKNSSIFPKFSPESNLQAICTKWINKDITNFEYLMYLNHMAESAEDRNGPYECAVLLIERRGRRFGDPSCHFIMPWVSDFATRTNGTWRDLSKSKFRLNKGDRQLDLTYENAVNSSQIPHHVSDVLSEITYFVYLSRRTPRSLLCKYVRSVWVPAEYPSSIQRLQEWTPDECIPEFFYDPTIFKSIHEDLPDLELPHWALTPEEFIEAHRECLESNHVSERLHHWIDLTFGYQLSGSAAVKSKNVCLHLVENHRKLKTSGVVQLFSYPHPARQFQLQYFEKIPPKTLFGCPLQQPSKKKTSMTPSDRVAGGSEDEGQSSGNGEDDSFGTKSSPLLFSKLINISKGSLLGSFQTTNDDISRPEQAKFIPTSAQTSNSNVGINIPKDFNPSGLLVSVEANQNFFRKTFLSQTSSTLFSEKKHSKPTLKQIIANKRIQEMQVLGCLIIEMFLHSKIRVVDTSDLNKRLNTCLYFLGSDSLPRCVRSALTLLLQPFRDLQSYPYITSSGLPPPSAHQLLQPLLSSFAFPFPSLFSTVYFAVCNLISCSKAISKHQVCNPHGSRISETLSVLKVNKLNADLEKIWEDLLSVKNDQIIELLLPFLKELFENPLTSRLSVILFFDKLCRSLGPNQTNELLLNTIINLYNSNLYEASENLYLYHKEFLLVLIVRCGLKVFLENFIGPLIEAVGRYKDSSKENWDDKSDSCVHDAESDVEIKHVEDDFSPDVKADEKDIEKECEAELFAFDEENCASNPDKDEAVRRAVEHLDLKLQSGGDQLNQDEAFSASYSGVRSLEINIPGNRETFVDADVPGRGEKSWNSRDGSQYLYKQGTQRKAYDKFECGNDNIDISQIKTSDVAGDSIIWLAHRLGPVLTARYLTRNLLRVLSLCYTGKDNLEPHKFTEVDEMNLWKLSVLKWKVVGDENVETVLRILGEISELYGEQIVLLQYFPFMSELFNLSKRKFTLSIEGGIIGCLSLLKYIVPYMNDSTLMDQLQDVILKSIVHPSLRLVSSTRFVFPSGQRGRFTLVSKLIDCLYLISLRIGTEMTKVHLAVPVLQRFFLAFDKAHGVVDNEAKGHEASTEYYSSNPPESLDENRYLEIQRDGTTTEWSVRGVPGQPISIAHVRSHESLDSSPSDQQDKNKIQNKALAELKSVFDAQLAHQCYGSFFRFLGEKAMENVLKNQNLIRDLYYRHEQEQAVYTQRGRFASQSFASSGKEGMVEKGCVGSFGSNVAVIGNKIEVQTVDIADSLAGVNAPMDSDVLALICRKKADYGRHLRGNWLAYWEHEIGRSEKDTKFNFKQIKLQSFNGHGNSVRMIQCLDNENSFISGSKDKTVKLWSLRSQGDGSSSNGCQFTYTHHRKSLLSLSFIHSVRLVASCDSTIHLWDPFEGKTISIMDNVKIAPINVLKALNPPSCNLIAATTEATLRIIDTRLCSFVSEYKISMNSVGLIRSICVSPNGHWIAIGQASGLLTVLDIRTGMVLSSWKGHEAEVLQLAAVGNNILISSSLDQTVSAWNVSDGKFKFHMKGPAEPVHCLAVYDSELITGTTANRIGVHTSIDSQASFSSTKLRSDAFKGILTSMTVLPLNRLLLLGADSGNITLLC